MVYKEMIEQFSKFYPIKGKKEEEFRKFLIENYLKDIDFELQEFSNRVPNGKSELYADNELINSYPSTFVSGEIDEKNIINNIYISQEYDIPNINFNPYSDDISAITHFINIPAITISRKDINKILNSEEIKGYVDIKQEKFKSANILIGNKNNPKNIVFTHYDTVLNGATDNSSGLALIINIIRNHKELLKENLFVICGSEELSYDFPIYWGYGYRVFEYEYKELMYDAKKIIVADTFGYDKPIINENEENMMEAFPINDLKKFIEKIYVLTSINIENKENAKLFYSFYHSNSDNINLINEEYMKEAEKMLLDLLI